MNIALIKAGGVGTRMNAGIPKQFVEVWGKPIIIYTLEAFEKHVGIDSIVVVCVEGWHEILQNYAIKFGIKKLKIITNGGETSLKSIRAGLDAIKKLYTEDDTILIHDGNRPLISQEIISDVIAESKKNGNAVAVIPCNDEIMKTDGQTMHSKEYLDHKKLYRIQTPEAYKLKDLLKLYENATEEQLNKLGATNVLMVESGENIYFARGSENNIRLTTYEDITLFESLFGMKNEKKID